MDAATAVLAGAVVGALASGAGVYIQQYFQGRRERQKMAVDLGVAEYNANFELAKGKPGAIIAPMAAYVAQNSRFLEALSSGQITPEKIRELGEERDRLLAAFPGAPKPTNGN